MYKELESEEEIEDDLQIKSYGSWHRVMVLDVTGKSDFEQTTHL
jgi:hypothetical protein